jgi:hypothetical protein
VYAWAGSSLQAKAVLDDKSAPVAAGTEMGRLQITNGVSIISVPVITKKQIGPPSVWWRFEHYF